MLCAKLRRAMVNPERGPLCGVVEADETIIPFRAKDDPVVLPAGRSGIGKMLLAGAVEVDGGTPRRARLKVIEGFGKQEIHAFVLGAVAPHTKLVTDDRPSYTDIPEINHKAITVGPMAAHTVLPWTHRLFSNLKRWGLGVYHGLRRTNLQYYLAVLPGRVRVPLQSTPHPARGIPYAARHRCPYRPSAYHALRSSQRTTPQHVELPDFRAQAFSCGFLVVSPPWNGDVSSRQFFLPL
jgi:hypothetical protein